jgi:hypothetical protein
VKISFVRFKFLCHQSSTIVVPNHEKAYLFMEQVEVMKGLLQVIPRHFICLKSCNFLQMSKLWGTTSNEAWIGDTLEFHWCSHICTKTSIYSVHLVVGSCPQSNA